jgi:hypothetical protein
MSDTPLFDFFKPPVDPPQVPGSRPAGELPLEVRRIIAFLRDRHGRAQGVPAPRIAQALGLLPGRPGSRRGTYVRDLISEHIFSFPFVIVGDTHAGYYRPSAPDELGNAIQSLDDRHIKIGRRRKAVVQIAKAEGWYQDDHGTWHTPDNAPAHPRAVASRGEQKHHL